MKTVIVSNEEEMTKASADALKDGLRLASMGTSGLPEGKLRLTFLPASAFTDSNSPSEEKKP